LFLNNIFILSPISIKQKNISLKIKQNVIFKKINTLRQDILFEDALNSESDKDKALDALEQIREKLETYYNIKALDPKTLPAGIDLNNIDFVVILGVGYSTE